MLSLLTVSVRVPRSGDSSAVAAASAAMLPRPSSAARQPRGQVEGLYRPPLQPLPPPLPPLPLPLPGRRGLEGEGLLYGVAVAAAAVAVAAAASLAPSCRPGLVGLARGVCGADPAAAAVFPLTAAHAELAR